MTAGKKLCLRCGWLNDSNIVLGAKFQADLAIKVDTKITVMTVL